MTFGGAIAGSTVCSPSEVISTAGTQAPLEIWIGRRSVTVPETPEWIGAETYPSARPIRVPTNTLSPFLTIGTAVAPICCCIGSRIFSGTGRSTVAIFCVFLLWARRAPFAARLKYFSFPENPSLFFPFARVKKLSRVDFAAGDALPFGNVVYIIQPSSFFTMKTANFYSLNRHLTPLSTLFW